MEDRTLEMKPFDTPHGVRGCRQAQTIADVKIVDVAQMKIAHCCPLSYQEPVADSYITLTPQPLLYDGHPAVTHPIFF